MNSSEQPGRVVVKPMDDAEYPWYWHAFVGELRVNGGVCNDYTHGTLLARGAIAAYRHQVFLDENYWDQETNEWRPKGELPLE